MDVPSGIATDSSSLSFSKALFLIVSSVLPSEKVTVVRDVQSRKALLPITVSAAGNSIPVMAVQPRKAASPISVRFAGSVIPSIDVLFLKTSLPIPVTV